MTLSYLIENKDITNLSNFKTPAKAKFYYEINNTEDINKLFEIESFAIFNNYKVLYIWWGTNLLFAFEEFDWIVVKNSLNWWKYDKNSKILESYWNEIISDIAESLEKDYNQNLWHRFIWLPGSIGWAVYWNAWCFWLEIENNFREAEVLDLETGNIKTLNKSEMDFEYRNSIIKRTGKYFIIKTLFDLSELVEKYSSDIDNLYFREYKQPKGNTCGSFFKNPSKDNSAWKLIEEVWLKGKEIWWAVFSELHANFLMNNGEAWYKDLLNLIELAQKEVKKKFNIDLISEVRIITN